MGNRNIENTQSVKNRDCRNRTKWMIFCSKGERAEGVWLAKPKKTEKRKVKSEK